MEMNPMMVVPKDLNGMDAYSTHEIAELWVQLTNAANVDQEAQAFLLMFEPWAKARHGLPS